MEFDSFDGGEDGELSDVCFVEIFKIFVAQATFFFAMESFDSLVLSRHYSSPHHALISSRFIPSVANIR